jgi:hypothetical protein
LSLTDIYPNGWKNLHQGSKKIQIASGRLVRILVYAGPGNLIWVRDGNVHGGGEQ